MTKFLYRQMRFFFKNKNRVKQFTGLGNTQTQWKFVDLKSGLLKIHNYKRNKADISARCQN